MHVLTLMVIWGQFSGGLWAHVTFGSNSNLLLPFGRVRHLQRIFCLQLVAASSDFLSRDAMFRRRFLGTLMEING
jgi:hypothetical protein